MADNSALARRWFEEWNERRDATVDELMHLEAVGHMLEIRGPSGSTSTRSTPRATTS